MDSRSIAYGCGTLIDWVTRLTVGIPIFVSNVRIARKDMDALLRELTSLQLCLNALRDDDQSASVEYPPSLTSQINQLLTNTEVVVRQINTAVIKLSSRKADNAAIWSSTECHEMVRCRSILESDRLALDLAVTMGTISKLLEQRKVLLDRLKALDRLSEGPFKNQNHGIALISEKDLETSSDPIQLDQLRHEIADFRALSSDLSNINVHENMHVLHREANQYIRSLLQPYPTLFAQLTNPKQESSLSPSTSVSTATSSSAFTKRSHSVACSTTSIDSRSDVKRCPACTRPLTTDDQEAAIHTWSDKYRDLRSSWQKDMEKEKMEVAYLAEEIERLQAVNSTLENGRVNDLDKHVDEIVKEKDLMIKQLREYLHAATFYADIKSHGLEGTIDSVRERYATWERRASTLSMEKLLDDPTMSTGAPAEEEGSDATTIEKPVNVQRKPLPRTAPQPTPPVSPPQPAREPAERVVFEFSVNFVKEDIYLRSLTGRHQTLPKPVIIHAYKAWATVDAVIRQILTAATGQTQPPKPSDLTMFYLTKVAQRYDNDERPMIHVQPLYSDHLVVNLNLLHGDKIRLMQGPQGFHLGPDRYNRYSFERAGGNRSTTVIHRERQNTTREETQSPDVNSIPSRSPNISPTSTRPDTRPGSISPHVRSDSMNSYLLQPGIVISRALSDHSEISANTRISQPTGTLRPVPLFEFRADKARDRILLKPRSLITNHSNNYYSNFEPPTTSNSYHELMITISMQASSDPVHFTEEDAAGNMRHYVTDLLGPLLRHWECDKKRVFLQLRSQLIHDSMPLREYGIQQGTSIWAMLKPYKPSDRSSLGFSSDQTIPADHELFLQQPDATNLQRMSFNDANFRRIVAQRRQ